LLEEKREGDGFNLGESGGSPLPGCFVSMAGCRDFATLII
jgi:hypothetical protein